MAARDIAIGLLFGGGEGHDRDLVFHDILNRGTVLCTHDIAGGYSIKLYGYYWTSEESGKHDHWTNAIFCGVNKYFYYEDFHGERICGVKSSGGVTTTNQFVVPKWSECDGAGIYAVIFKNNAPIYAVRNNFHLGLSSKYWCIQRVEDENGGYKDVYFVESAPVGNAVISQRGGSISSPKLYLDGNNTPIGVTGIYNGGGFFQLVLRYQQYIFDEESGKPVPEGDPFTVQRSVVTDPYGIEVLPLSGSYERQGESINAARPWKCLYSDLDVQELLPIFQEVIDAMRKEAGIASYPVEILEPEV